MNKDLTVGNPRKVLLKFCLPLFGSMIFQQLYNLADSVVAGQFIGENALAAVGNGYEITLIFLAFAFGLNIGCSVMVSRFFGEKKIEAVKTSVATTFIMAGVCLAFLITFGLVFCRDLLVLINTPESILNDSTEYLNIYIYGLVFVFFYNISTGVFSALGDSVTPFWFLFASSVGNIGMDILFVTVFKMGVAGVAWATFICQGISCVLAVTFVFFRLRKMKTTGKVKYFSYDVLKKITAIAFPSFLQQSFVSVGNIIIQGVINSFGEAAIAGYSGAIKLNSFLVTSLFTLGNGISNFTSQNLGAKKTDRISAGFRAGIAITIVIAVICGAMYYIFGEHLLKVFMDEGEAMRYGVRFLSIVAPSYIFVAIKVTSDGILRGSGKMIRFLISTFADLAIRVVGAIIMSGIWQTDGIWFSWPIGWILGSTLSFVFYLTLLRNFKKQNFSFNEQTES